MRETSIKGKGSAGRRLVNHVFLPLELPKDSLKLAEDELELLRLFNGTVQAFNVGLDSESEFIKTKGTFNAWETLQENIDPAGVAAEIGRLTQGESLALYIQAQNCGLIITILEETKSNNAMGQLEEFPTPAAAVAAATATTGVSSSWSKKQRPSAASASLFSEERAVFSSFPASRPSEIITSSSSSLASVFPTSAVVVPKSRLLNSQSFAQQLYDLNFIDMREAVATVHKDGIEAHEKRDVADPLYISQWLTATLADRKSRSASEAEFPRVVKKIRDSIVYGEKVLPFRRSGMYTCMKVVLNVCLVRDLGSVNGTFLYKLILIKFMLTFFKNFEVNSNNEGLVVEMMTKVARRAAKLENYLQEQQEKVSPWLESTFADLMTESAIVLKLFRNKVKTVMEGRLEFGKNSAHVDLRNIKLWVHLTLKNSKFQENFLTTDHQSIQSKMKRIGKIHIPLPPTPPRHRANDSLFEPMNFHTDTELGIVLCDFERNVMQWQHLLCSQDGYYVWDLYQKYLQFARPFYSKDPIGVSRMILTLLKILQVWDYIVCNKFPSLLLHRTGVDLNFGKDLLIYREEDARVLFELEGYFKHREKHSTFPSLVEESSVSVDSFAARYASQNPVMMEVRKTVELFGERKSKEKLQEVKEARARVEKLEAEIRQVECQYVVDDWKRRHDPKCVKCRLRKAERKVMIRIYETPLPVGFENQFAVIFELLIPTPIAILRDILYLFRVETMSSNCTDGGEGLYGPWHCNGQLKSLNRRDKNWIVSLMSTKKSVEETHYKELHATLQDMDFVRPISYNCFYVASSAEVRHILGNSSSSNKQGGLSGDEVTGIKSRCTFQVVKKSRYGGMQYGINGNCSSSNDVIARQCECSLDLSLVEFVEFGSLRSEIGLQWRNIFRALTQSTLSLKEESVFNLICQSIFQASPVPAWADYRRQAHRDFAKDGSFASEFLNLLEIIRERHESNWTDHYIMLTVIMLAQRINVLSPETRIQGVELLAACRQDTLRWSKEIQRILSTLTNAPRSDVDSLRVKLIQVNVCCALTFYLDRVNLIQMLMGSGEELVYWLLAVAKIHDNKILLGPKTNLINITLRNFLRRVDEVGVYLEPFLQRAATSLLTNFVTKHHNQGSRAWRIEEQQMDWHAYEDCQQIYYCDIYPSTQEEYVSVGDTITKIQIDIIKGRFLVDGCPVGYLATSIENHPDFQRVFSTTSFEVQSYAYQNGRMITRDRYLGSAYSFYLAEDGQLTITEHRENSELELVPHTYFKDNVPHLLIKNYTHWFNKKSKMFEFFYREEDKPSKLSIKKPDFILEMGEKTLYFCNTPNRLIVDINCEGYSKIIQVVERLEHKKFVTIWSDRRDKSFSVEMPRLSLQLSVRNVNGQMSRGRFLDLTSKEYRGMRVSRDQETLGTLVGLKAGLLLEDADINSTAKMNSVLLMPHGTVFKKDGKVFIDVGRKDIRSPPFFAYEVDYRLKQLKAGESRAGWIYLAHLHALTSQPFPDSFTGVTGTERALQILQSGQCWSSQPIDRETLTTLKDISELSPVRDYYPKNMKTMETVGFKHPPHISHDAFRLVVDKLIKDSERLHFLFPDCCYSFEEPLNLESNRELYLKGYWRRAAVSTELGRISPDFDGGFKESPVIVPLLSSSSTKLNEQVRSVLLISQLCHEWNSSPPNNPPYSGLLKSLLMNGKDLKGVFFQDEEGGGGFPIKEGVNCWAKLSFREYWLDLYNLAKKVGRRRELQANWTLLLTYFAFRHTDSVPLDQIKLLQMVARNPDDFCSIVPPPFEEYSMTNEHAFNRPRVASVLESHKMTWESYLDRQEEKERMCYEDELEFAERLRPLHEELVKKQAEEMSERIFNNWPCSDCDDLVEKIDRVDGDGEESVDEEGCCSEIRLDTAVRELNILLKNWYRNRELEQFLTQVELTISKLAQQQNNKSNQQHSVFKDTRRSIFANTGQAKAQELERFCGKPLYTINLMDVILGKGEAYVDKELVEKAAKVFGGYQPAASASFEAVVDNKRKSSSNNNNNKVEDPVATFPLEMVSNCPILEEYMKDLELSWEAYQKLDNKLGNKPLPRDTLIATINISLKRHKTSALSYWEKAKESLRPIEPNPLLTNCNKMLIYSELFPRIVPLTLLPLILLKNKGSHPFFNYLKNLIGAYAVEVTLEQKDARCVRYGGRGKKYQEGELMAELGNRGHVGWNPAQRPEWLLFEIEMDLMVRPIQAKVAERMENPENNENALIQLNMGEGKTYVIVPLLVLSLANGRQLCRVTVLKSLYQMNKNSLVSKIGSLLLNRRVYSFPCRRDYQIGSEEAREMLRVYEECVEQAGVVMTLPEHRLSFELKAYERCHAASYFDARSIFEVQDWLKRNARDILDESDEILHVKYQLIYTLGKQLAIGGGSLRWSVIQDLLAILPREIEALMPKFGPSYMEYNKKEGAEYQFPHVRILKMDCCDELNERMARAVLNGESRIQIPDIGCSTRKELLMRFLTQEQLDRESFNGVFRIYPIQAHQEILLILRACIACGVLTSSLTKRWRVNYGINPTGYRRMAVPFRAKDVASERTEFGHPDVAILLTELSYYYSGLTDEQLEQCFSILNYEPNPSQEYQKWIERVPLSYPGYGSISHLSGINLNDLTQKSVILFPMLKQNIATIDFWLSRVVFPQESKQFGWKIGCSPWDLCQGSKTRKHPVTGFSGTNDSKILLPKTISQKDLRELQGTNGLVLKSLLLPENDKYEDLGPGITGKEILQKLVDTNLRVLLDVGALMLELDNEQVARTWLKLLEENQVDCDAAVYFDEYDKLVVMDRSGNPPCAFEISTFRTRLDRCVIYLDDVHTRGTDLRIPMRSEACVTLGKGVTKDKLVQGCMRMRKLGQLDGHRVRFWASQEVHNGIKGMMLLQLNNNNNNDKKNKTETGENSNKIGTKEVLQWTILNNQQQIKDGFIHWAAAGVYQAQKLSSLAIFSTTFKKDSDLTILAESCSQKEQIELKNMYGEVRTLQKFPVIVQFLLARVNRELGKLITRKTNLNVDIKQIVEFFGNSVQLHSIKYVGDMMRSTQLLDEEQERELEHELEAQHQKQLPVRAKGLDHESSEDVLLFILSGQLHKIESWAVKLPLTLKSTSLWNCYPDDGWGKHVYASQDFSKVVRPSGSSKDNKMDDFLRPVNWFASVQYSQQEEGDGIKRKEDRSCVVLLLSPYEANLHLELFRSGHAKAVLHMFAPRMSQNQDSLHRNPSLIVPRQNPEAKLLTAAINACLLLYSGSSYFSSREDQEEYCHFVGFCPRPRTQEEEAMFEAGMIVDGFLLPEFASLLLDYRLQCPFKSNPEKLIRGLVQRRFGTFSIDSHVGKVVFQATKPF